MADQVHANRSTQKNAEAVKDETTPTADRKLVGVSDEILDEIDEILETNAEEFVKNYIQKSGQ